MSGGDKEIDLPKVDWIYYLSRPFDLFGSSIWDEWYTSDETKKILGTKLTRGLFIESPKGMSRNYRDKIELDQFLKVIENLLLENPGELVKILSKAREINEVAREHIKRDDFIGLEQTVLFLIQLAIYGALFPHFTGENLEKNNIKNKEIEEWVRELRLVSYYPEFFQKVVMRHAKNLLMDKGYSLDDLQLLTYKELIGSKKIDLSERRMGLNQSFIYKKISGVETIHFVNSNTELINKVENKTEQDCLIRGDVACKGRVIGKVRLVLTNLLENAIFEAGDILVAIHTSPNLLPIMKKASAIITDEGGIVCHAAIISRELNVPCIIGTKTATQVLKDGDMVEVDADKGIVRKI